MPPADGVLNAIFYDYDERLYAKPRTHVYPPHFCKVLTRQREVYTLACGVRARSATSHHVGDLMPCPACTPRVPEV